MKDYGIDEEFAGSSQALISHLEVLRSALDKKLDGYQLYNIMTRPTLV